ncbi:PLD nuclease N-terminal domain-containing protein [Citrobacter sedlakii]|uniref:PLD nuclease N-terminal domain-containing protein n=1 Tax=Citrobacter sedlakii TaxID=67826 RepID=UPI000FB3C61D|nr:PLD nuclease N-terminal domain-containing protein [Citrobacter sedlakii]EFM0751974.1 PLDc_N domain-containing protein [Salmonella enterica subsp. enterica serovar Bredeney]EHS1318637.1 PLDc_N domain-containing protein [Salmonella enterica subsp. enterica serovar Reading]MJU56281.1 hypothetical protein [Salmonella enterica subsp. enterica serovar Montevideo]MCZ4677019.1 PLD nuclease N-terminal domain-containing protein [Citrobacter sedlakii]MDR5007076.1 PLD nuclease N-terminal domain-contain
MSEILLTLWDSFVTVFFFFFFVAYLLILFHILSDLFRDKSLNGVAKAVWVIFLIFIPLVTSLVYLVFRGKGMAERYRAELQSSVAATDAYIRHVAGKSPAEQIRDARKLLEENIITEDEYRQLKTKALG